ncbi:Calcium permeable stress-gated cation channel 1 [Linum perenne]
MATVVDISVSAGINLLTAFIFLLAFAFLRLQPFNDRVYFPKWYLKGLRHSPSNAGQGAVSRVVNLNFSSYLRFLNWIPDALKMPELELIEHAGLDSAVYLRIYLLGLKIFVPISAFAWVILFPVNWTNHTLDKVGNVTASDIDKLSISNIPQESQRFWAHIVMAYAFTFWTFYILVKEYEKVASMRLQFMASEKRRPDQFTVVYNANKLASLVKKKKSTRNRLDYYQLKYSRNQAHRPTIKTGFLGLRGEKVDAIDFYTSKMEKLSVEQVRNPTLWLTDWASEPRDVYWKNLAIPYVSLTVRRLIVGVAFFFLTFFFMIPIAMVQSLASIEGIEKAAPFLEPIIEAKFIKSVVQGFLPGIALKLFLIFLPTILMIMSKFEGFISVSSLERRAATRFYIFNIINVFLGSIIAGTAFEQLNTFMKKSTSDIPKIIGVAIPMKATFFITYIMVDGWAGIAGEILMLKPLIINVYNQEYESAAAFWPAVHGRVLIALVISQLLMMGLLTTKGAALATPFLIALPVLTYWFYKFCQGRYEPAFVRYPLQEAMMKDTLERAREPNLNLKGYLQQAYVHPVFKGGDDDDDEDEEEYGEIAYSSGKVGDSETALVPTKRQSRRNTPAPSKVSAGSSPSLAEVRSVAKGGPPEP